MSYGAPYFISDRLEKRWDLIRDVMRLMGINEETRVVSHDALPMVHRHWCRSCAEIIVALILKNYLGVGFTRIGRILLSVSVILLIESVSMIAIYYVWSTWGLGMEVAAPILLITVLNLIAISLLYIKSRL
ncbi:hypothetical protein [Vulcanisaeta sp. JCM 16159]|uniref:hypothetical protein n=1 Tax=Vulcanisaeta sp. JCM 16159 TaxID=1295371 RepID=UPI000AE5B50F|nr:hypothetical protein [Vulcanisaeta sp. JCM 16159]